MVNAWYVDCGAAYEGPPVASVSGLDYLEGMTVDVLADGSPQPQKVVTAGAIDVDPPASKVIVGAALPLGDRHHAPRRGRADGTAQGKLKRVHELAVRFHETVGAKVGPSEDQLDTISSATRRCRWAGRSRRSPATRSFRTTARGSATGACTSCATSRCP
jgi:hypothetical protein